MALVVRVVLGTVLVTVCQGNGHHPSPPSTAAVPSTTMRSYCDDDSSGGLLSRTLCLEMNNSIPNSQDQHGQPPSRDEPRHLQNSRRESPYVNQGNAVHILRQYQQKEALKSPTPSHGQRTSLSNSPYEQWGMQGTPLHTSNIHLSSSHAHMMEPSGTRINSKLMSHPALAPSGSHRAGSTQISQTDQTFQGTQDSHGRTMGQYSPHSQAWRTLAQNSHSENDSHRQANTNNKPSFPLGTQAPIGTNRPSQEEVDMADILTNLQILTILLNGDGLHLPQSTGHPHNVLTAITNQDSNYMNLISEASMPDSDTRPTPHLQGKNDENKVLRSNSPAAPLHQMSTYEIQARNNKQQQKNYNYATQFPFAINPPHDSPTPSGGISMPNDDRQPGGGKPETTGASPGHSYFISQPPSPIEVPSASPTKPYDDDAPDYWPSHSSHPLSNDDEYLTSQTVATQANNDDDGRLIYQDPTNTVPAGEDKIDHDKLIHQFAHQHVPSYSHHPPGLAKPQGHHHGSQSSLNQVTALSQYLENLKKKYNQNQPTTSSPVPQNYPIKGISNEDLILATLLHSHFSNTERPAIISAETPYIPAIHGDKFTHLQEPQPPAPPPTPPVSPDTSSSLSGSVQSDSSSSSSGSSGSGGIQGCLGNQACAMFISFLMSHTITTAITIPLLAPFIGKRRRRDISHLMKSIQDPLKLQGTKASFVKELPPVDLPIDLKYINSLFLNPKPKTSTIVNKILKYIAKNKEKLLKIAVKETEDLFHRIIPKDLQIQLIHANTNRLLTLLNETLIMQENAQEKGTLITHGKMSVPMTTDKQQDIQHMKRYDPDVHSQMIHVNNIREGEDELIPKDSFRLETEKLSLHSAREIGNITHSNPSSPMATAAYSQAPQSDHSNLVYSQSEVTEIVSNDQQKHFASKPHISLEGSSSLLKQSNLSGNVHGAFQSNGTNPLAAGQRNDFHEHQRNTNQANVNYKMPNMNEYNLSPPPRYSSGTRKRPLDTLPNPHTSNINQKLMQTGQEAPPSSTDEALVTTKFPRIYRSVCRALTRPDVPHNDIINFIAQRCLLLAYVGMLK